jgi:hypothetical protein
MGKASRKTSVGQSPRITDHMFHSWFVLPDVQAHVWATLPLVDEPSGKTSNVSTQSE